ncbi:ParA family protein [Streptomyces albiaxialis]
MTETTAEPSIGAQATRSREALPGADEHQEQPEQSVDLFRPEGTRVLAMCNQKGGVGKTTTTINLAGALAEYGRRVLVLDGDPQGNATTGLHVASPGPRDLTQAQVVLDALDPQPLIAQTNVPNIQVLPASLDMTGLSSDLRDTGTGLTLYRVMVDKLRALGLWDDILIDQRPALELDTDAQLVASDGAIIMVDVDEWSMDGLKRQVAQHKKAMARAQRDDFEVVGLVVGRVQKPMGHFDKAVYDLLRAHPTIRCLAEIPVRAADIKESRHQGLPVCQARPRTDTAQFFREIALKGRLVKAA